MRKVFRKFSARVAVLVADESGMSTVEYSNVVNYTHSGSAGLRRRYSVSMLCATGQCPRTLF